MQGEVVGMLCSIMSSASPHLKLHPESACIILRLYTPCICKDRTADRRIILTIGCDKQELWCILFAFGALRQPNGERKGITAGASRVHCTLQI